MRGGIRGNRGGQKGRSGRRSKAEELGLQSLLESAFTAEDRRAVLQNLTTIAKGNDAKAAVSAASLLFGYAFGKPKESLEHSGKDGGPIQTSATVVIIPDNGREQNRSSARSTDSVSKHSR